MTKEFEYKSIVEPSMIAFGYEFQKAIQEGWEINPLEYPDFSRVFSVGLMRKPFEDFLPIQPFKERLDSWGEPKVGSAVVASAEVSEAVVEAPVVPVKRSAGRPKSK